MEYYVVKERSSKIREIARYALAGYWKKVIAAMLIYYFVSSGVGIILDSFFTFSQNVDLYGNDFAANLPYGGSIYSFVVGGPLEFGITMYLLAFFRAKQTDNKIIFEGFSYFGKSFILMLLISVKVLLWSLLLVIPGIVATFKYSQAFYVMVDNPHLTPGQCIKESCRIMNGNKMSYFFLGLSFIGWIILVTIPGSVIGAIFSEIYASDISVIVSILSGIPTVFIDVYMLVAYTAFYELATRRLVVVNEELPETEETL